MGQENRYKKFQELLTFAIGNHRKQAQFAKDAGLSRYHVNRLLNSDEIGKPSRQTLRKIADASEGRVQMDDLIESLGENVKEEKTEEKESFPVPHDEYARIRDELQGTIEKFKKSVLDRCHRVIKYDNICSFLDSVKLFNDLTMIDCSIGDSIDYVKNDHYNAEKAVDIVCIIDNDDVVVTFGMELYYCETKGGGLIFFDAAFDLASLFECKHEHAVRLMMKLSEKKNAVISDYKTVAFIKWKKPEVVLDHNRNMDALIAMLKIVTLKKGAREEEIQEIRDLIKDDETAKKLSDQMELAAMLIAAGDGDTYFDYDEEETDCSADGNES